MTYLVPLVSLLIQFKDQMKSWLELDRYSQGWTRKLKTTYRFVTLLNKQLDDRFSLPNIAEALDSASGATYFSHLDLLQDYYQLSKPFVTSQEKFPISLHL